MNEVCNHSEAVATERDFRLHLQDWMNYLCRLLDRCDNQAEKAKYERQLRWLLGFHEGTNLSLKHNLLIDRLYAGQIQADEASAVPRLSPVQDCYQQRGHAFEQIEKALVSPALFLMQGPPGTGKTTAIAETVLQTLARHPKARILIASETHVAVDNALDRIFLLLTPAMRRQVYRHQAFAQGSEMEYAQAYEAELVEKANNLWAQAQLAAPELTCYLWQRFATENDRIPHWLAKTVADNHQIVGVTCNQIEHLIDGQALSYDLAIVDECSKATLPEWLMAVSVAHKAILVGDHKQLPPTFCQAESDALAELNSHQEALIRDGFIDRLFLQAPDSMKGTLLTQYRMQPNIGEFISRAFYDDQLTHGRQQTEEAMHNFGWLPCTNHGSCPNPDLPKDRQRLENPGEVAAIRKALMRFSEHADTGVRTVAVITPYRAQARALRQMVNGLPSSSLVIEVDTVDAFQGRQADVVFFSFVRNNGSAKFYGDSRRINVALSRARDRVYLVGDRRYLRTQRRYPVLRALLKLPQYKDHR